MSDLLKAPLNAEEQENLMSSFWTMLKELESKCLNEPEDVLLRHWVTQWYSQWNRLTGSDMQPAWSKQ